jgi:hypothetical protein
MYGLPQLGLIANKLLEEQLKKLGYWQSKLVPGLWKHNTRPIQFTLVVDNFGIKYTRKEDVEHLKSVIELNYTVTAYWTGNRYIGITLNWDYKQRQVHLSMPSYVKKALKLFQNEVRKKNNMHHTHAHQSYTELRYNTQSQQYNHHRLMPKQRSSSNKCVGSSSS